VVDFSVANCAAAASLIPGVERADVRSVKFAFDSVAETYKCFEVVCVMAGGASQPIYG
jgi:D-amino peptidase